KAGVGTVIVARVTSDSRSSSPRPADAAVEPIEIAGVCTAAPGEHVSGDAWAALQQGSRGSLMVADGLGHGPEAAKAADAATALLEARPDDDLTQLLGRTHDALQGTRGAAVALLRCDSERGEIWYCGAGNIVGRMLSGTEDKSLMTQHGTV